MKGGVYRMLTLQLKTDKKKNLFPVAMSGYPSLYKTKYGHQNNRSNRR